MDNKKRLQVLKDKEQKEGLTEAEKAEKKQLEEAEAKATV